ncbi:MAG: sulfatase-like hydrolase/transferase [Acidobacteria bacterium]|nr:sulfatase-like hydrolase/transferase [Acidobacteriota bacterium]
MEDFSRRTFLASPGALQAQDAARPNVLVVMFDQWRYDCLGANGNRLIRTPNLDKLAAQSLNFSHAFVQAPVCVPSRISYLTGRYPHCHKNRVNYTPYRQPEPMLQRLLKDSGYRTGSVGKLHFRPGTNAHAKTTGFDLVQLDDGIPRTDRYSDYAAWRRRADPDAQLFHYNETVKGRPKDKNPFLARCGREYTPTAWTGLETRAMLRELAGGSQPFFLFSSFFKPHAPYTVPSPYDSMYDRVEIPLPKRVDMDYIRGLPLPVQRMILRFSPQFETDRELLQWMWRSYYAGVSMLDDEVGRILAELEKTGKADNTAVFVLSDHGDQMLEHGLFGKNVFFEDSVRVPMLIRWPGRLAAGQRTALTEAIDVMPTILAMCRVAVPAHVQGRSVLTELRREMVFCENIMPEVITNADTGYPFVPGRGIDGVRHPDAKMVRTDRWKLNYYPDNGCELYDLANDPGEWNNLARSEPERVNELKGALLDWLSTADETDQIARHWEI